MGCFITFEGIEGCGKTTQMQRVAALLQAEGHAIRLTREPGGCPIADQIRSILLDAGNCAMVPTAELLLYAAARAQHVAEIIRPALMAGHIVICDRFIDATYAYQGIARGLDLELVSQLNNLATDGMHPDLTIVVDCPVDVGLGRAKARIAGSDGPREERFELEAQQFHERVRAGYLQLAASDPSRYRVIDGTATIEQVTITIHDQIAGYLASRGN